MTERQDIDDPGADDAEAQDLEDGRGRYDKEEEEIQDGMVQDLVTGTLVKLNAKEAIRQEEERKLMEELGYDQADYQDLIRLNLSIKPSQGKSKRFPLVVLHQPQSQSRPGKTLPPAKRAYILYDIQPSKKAEDSKAGAENLAELLKDIPSAQYAVWTNGTDQIVWFKQRTALKTRTLYANDIPRYGKGIEDTSSPAGASCARPSPAPCGKPFGAATTTSSPFAAAPTRACSGSC